MAKFLAAEDFNPTILIVILALLIIVFFVMPMFTRKKQKDSYTNLLNSIKVGDKVKTIGGIIGTVIEIIETSPTDKNIVVSTGTKTDKHIMVFDINAVYQVITNPVLAATSKEEVEAAVKEMNAKKAKEEEEARIAAEKAAAIKAEAMGKAPMQSTDAEEKSPIGAEETSDAEPSEKAVEVKATEVAAEDVKSSAKPQSNAKRYNKK